MIFLLNAKNFCLHITASLLLVGLKEKQPPCKIL